jgi:hypothetical protein
MIARFAIGDLAIMARSTSALHRIVIKSDVAP